MKFAILVFTFLPLFAHGTLIDRGLFDDGFGGMIRLIYDDDINATWLGDPNFAVTSGFDADGIMTWDDAVEWTDGLTIGGFDDWRLPTTLNPDPSCSNPSNGDQGFNCTGGEMGHLFYVEGISRLNPDPCVSTPREVGDSAVREDPYWSGTSYDFCAGPCAWIFIFQNGIQDQRLNYRQHGRFVQEMYLANPPSFPLPLQSGYSLREPKAASREKR